ncbi:MAG UNVERIFIED_CONTAM: hypothetical protein LVR18_21095 [Planctomycetaceae bacterium]
MTMASPNLLDPLPSQKTPYLFLSSQGRTYNKLNKPLPDDYDVHPSSNGQSSEDLQAAYFTVEIPYKAQTPRRLPNYFTRLRWSLWHRWLLHRCRSAGKNTPNPRIRQHHELLRRAAETVVSSQQSAVSIRLSAVSE